MRVVARHRNLYKNKSISNKYENHNYIEFRFSKTNFQLLKKII